MRFRARGTRPYAWMIGVVVLTLLPLSAAAVATGGVPGRPAAGPASV
jgi:hypothetical protein